MRTMLAAIAVVLFTAVCGVYVAVAGSCGGSCNASHDGGCGAKHEVYCESAAINCKDGAGVSIGEVKSMDGKDGSFVFQAAGSEDPVTLVAQAKDLAGIKPGDQVKVLCEDEDGCRVTDIRKIRIIKHMPKRCVDIKP